MQELLCENRKYVYANAHHVFMVLHNLSIESIKENKTTKLSSWKMIVCCDTHVFLGKLSSMCF